MKITNQQTRPIEAEKKSYEDKKQRVHFYTKHFWVLVFESMVKLDGHVLMYTTALFFCAYNVYLKKCIICILLNTKEKSYVYTKLLSVLTGF